MKPFSRFLKGRGKDDHQDIRNNELHKSRGEVSCPEWSIPMASLLHSTTSHEAALFRITKEKNNKKEDPFSASSVNYGPTSSSMKESEACMEDLVIFLGLEERFFPPSCQMMRIRLENM